MSSKITLFAQRTIQRGVWRRMSEPDFVGAYSKEQQRKNKEQDKQQRERSPQEKINTWRKIKLGGLMVKYFPELKELNPAVESDFKSVAGALAALASDPGFLKWWAAHMKNNGPAGSPTGPVES